MPIRAVAYVSEAGPAVAGDPLGLCSGKLDIWSMTPPDSTGVPASQVCCCSTAPGSCSTWRGPKTV